MAGLVVIGYDGSDDAQRAVDLAAGALRADAAIVVNVWSIRVTATQPGTPFGAPSPPSEAELQRSEQAVDALLVKRKQGDVRRRPARCWIALGPPAIDRGVQGGRAGRQRSGELARCPRQWRIRFR